VAPDEQLQQGAGLLLLAGVNAQLGRGRLVKPHKGTQRLTLLSSLDEGLW
jgi:hypothetical protein